MRVRYSQANTLFEMWYMSLVLFTYSFGKIIFNECLVRDSEFVRPFFEAEQQRGGEADRNWVGTWFEVWKRYRPKITRLKIVVQLDF